MLPLTPQAKLPLKRHFLLKHQKNKSKSETYVKGNVGGGVGPACGITFNTVCCWIQTLYLRMSV